MRNDVWKTISFRQSKEEVKGKSNEEEEENVRITKRQPSIEFVGRMLNHVLYLGNVEGKKPESLRNKPLQTDAVAALVHEEMAQRVCRSVGLGNICT